MEPVHMVNAHTTMFKPQFDLRYKNTSATPFFGAITSGNYATKRINDCLYGVIEPRVLG